MPTIRVEKNSNYSVIGNYHLRDPRLSLKAKGLLTLVLSLPDNWSYSVEGLASLCVEGLTSVETGLKELKRYGYLRVDKIPPNDKNGGRFQYVYNIFEKSTNTDYSPLILGVGNLGLENLGEENLPLYKVLNNQVLNNTPYSPPEPNPKTEDFNKFWAAYPKKVDKQNALKAFKKIKVPVDVLLKALEEHKKQPDWLKDKGKFIPHPATWLNGKRWEDEIGVSEAEPEKPTTTYRRLT